MSPICTKSLALLTLFLAAGALAQSPVAQAREDGYDLWLRYHMVADQARRAEYRSAIMRVVTEGTSPTLNTSRDELAAGLRGLLGADIPLVDHVSGHGDVIIGTPENSPTIAALALTSALHDVGAEGFVIRTVRIGGTRRIVIAANRDVGVLYGAFHFLRLLQTQQPVQSLRIASAPRIQLRMLDHWDNLDRTVERGYAGPSLWDWNALPGDTSSRYRDYARANASIGINATVLTNVNANAAVLTPAYLTKVAALAGIFRPYGIRVFLTARFSAPIELGGLKTADPLDSTVRAWWKHKADEIYSFVPDFGGFLVKANSEGQPGPQDYHRTHADGANMLADAVAAHGGMVMWRAFVYSNDVPVDRVKQAWDEFKPLDGQFRENVFVQVKNGALDFQPREPFHPLFGSMPKTPLMMEFQITKEYLGMASHLVYLAPLFKEVLDSDSWATGRGSTVAKVIDGTLHGYAHTGMAGVSNVGSNRNWTGSHFNQANWYAFGRLAWDHHLSSARIADEWIRMTFSNDSTVVARVRGMMLMSRNAAVDYMTPLGLAHQMARNHHYGPGPWVAGGPRADWTSVYFHRADTLGIGFDRTSTGSNAVSQYFAPVRDKFANRATVPDENLLWFHRVRWTETMHSGRTLWNELLYRYQRGVDSVRTMQRTWNTLAGRIDSERFADVQRSLATQEQEARWWRDACTQYFATFSRLPFPARYEKPEHDLDFYLRQINRGPPGN